MSGAERHLAASAAETEALGERLAGRLSPGDIILLVGEMGAGKTTFVRGAARALGARGPVTSPTYALANRYEAVPPIAHLDLHRIADLRGEDEGLLEDHLTADVVAFIEWPEVTRDLLPRAPRATVTFESGRPDVRTITIEDHRR